MSWVRVIDSAELENHVPHPVSVDGRDICIVRVDGELHAFDDACPHRQWPLHAGRLEGHVLTCRAHTWEWDVRNGELQRMRAPSCLTMHEIREAAGAVEVQLRPDAPPPVPISALWLRMQERDGVPDLV